MQREEKTNRALLYVRIFVTIFLNSCIPSHEENLDIERLGHCVSEGHSICHHCKTDGNLAICVELLWGGGVKLENFDEEYWRKGTNHEQNNLKLQTNKTQKTAGNNKYEQPKLNLDKNQRRKRKRKSMMIMKIMIMILIMIMMMMIWWWVVMMKKMKIIKKKKRRSRKRRRTEQLHRPKPWQLGSLKFWCWHNLRHSRTFCGLLN